MARAWITSNLYGRAILPLIDEQSPLPDFHSTVQCVTPHRVDSNHDFSAEVSDLLNLNVEALKVADELLREAADRRDSLEGLAPPHIAYRV